MTWRAALPKQSAPCQFSLLCVIKFSFVFYSIENHYWQKNQSKLTNNKNFLSSLTYSSDHYNIINTLIFSDSFQSQPVWIHELFFYEMSPNVGLLTKSLYIQCAGSYHKYYNIHCNWFTEFIGVSSCLFNNHQRGAEDFIIAYFATTKLRCKEHILLASVTWSLL